MNILALFKEASSIIDPLEHGDLEFDIDRKLWLYMLDIETKLRGFDNENSTRRGKLRSDFSAGYADLVSREYEIRIQKLSACVGEIIKSEAPGTLDARVSFIREKLRKARDALSGMTTEEQGGLFGEYPDEQFAVRYEDIGRVHESLCARVFAHDATARRISDASAYLQIRGFGGQWHGRHIRGIKEFLIRPTIQGDLFGAIVVE